ncbi:outer membrane beta-barrel protein [Novosphingobium album (ex Hu et al. 2023)]|uniref:Outer membrane beta-barrel protein n=1 Tax=Novosphingobium album (ex Hu et al. 2023) TaxID=2930093 RepID=A0ABT0B4S4_9SPHN|nr:outer membrane beta-barrel protein [Novosphingobium album (ex Hu et al. 2023)]MCJ2180023.1 outer membrane beta-barrel protein [Novosphingobium album (ex Hu et al. 2023)]
MKGGLARLALSSGAAMAPALAGAQAIGAGTSIVIDPALDRDDVAGARIEPALRSRPIIVGPVFAQPSLSVVGGYDSNVFNRPAARAGALAMVMPSLQLRANLPRHAFAVLAAGTVRRFSRYRTENSEEFRTSANGRLDFGARNAIRASGGFSHLIEPRSSAGSVPDADEPVSYDRLEAELGVGLASGPFHLASNVQYERLDYDPVSLVGGGRADQSFRDTRKLRGEARLDYDLSGLVSVFGAVFYEDLASISAPADERRDAHGYAVAAGVRGALSPVVSGEVRLGYQWRDYALPAYRDFHGLTFRADLQWYVTPLVTLRAQASRTFRNSGDRNVGAILTDAFVLSTYYDPLRNLRLSATAALEHGDFGEVGTSTWRKSGRVRAQYHVNRSLSFGVYADFVRQDVSGPRLVNAFTAFSAGLGATVTA